MQRLGAIFIAICMVVIAASVGAVFHFRFGLSISEAASIGFGVLLTLLLIHYQISRVRDRMVIDEQMDDLTRLKLSLTKEVQDVRELAQHLEKTVEGQVQNEVDPILAELDVLGSLVKQLAESCAELDDRVSSRDDEITAFKKKLGDAANTVQQLDDLLRSNLRNQKAKMESLEAQAQSQSQIEAQEQAKAAGAAIAAAAQPASQAAASKKNSEIEEETALRRETAEKLAHIEKPELAVSEEDETAVRRALALNKLELHMQPVVSLPMRKPRFYEALTRLKRDDGSLITPDIFLPVCRKNSFLPMLDRLSIHEAFTLMRRLADRGKPVDCFCNLSLQSLADGDFFSHLRDLFEQNRDLAEHIILEFSQSDYRQFGLLEDETLQSLRSMGFRFSVDQITNLNTDFDALARKGVQFAKVAAPVLTHRDAGRGLDIHPADFSRVLSRKGLDLVVTHVETEAVLVDLIDFSIQLAQGDHFAPAMPLRPSGPVTSEAMDAKSFAASPASKVTRNAGQPTETAFPVHGLGASQPTPPQPRQQPSSGSNRTLGDNPQIAQALNALSQKKPSGSSTQDDFRSVLAQAAGVPQSALDARAPSSSAAPRATPAPINPAQPSRSADMRLSGGNALGGNHPVERGQFLDLSGSDRSRQRPMQADQSNTQETDGSATEQGSNFERVIR